MQDPVVGGEGVVDGGRELVVRGEAVVDADYVVVGEMPSEVRDGRGFLVLRDGVQGATREVDQDPWGEVLRCRRRGRGVVDAGVGLALFFFRGSSAREGEGFVYSSEISPLLRQGTTTRSGARARGTCWLREKDAALCQCVFR